MPVSKLNLEDERYSFLKPLFDTKKEYINFYNTNLSSKGESNWTMLPLYAAHFKYTPEGNQFNNFKTYINSLPEHITPMLFTFSSIKGKTNFHEESWTKREGFHRIHIPLRNVENCSLFIKEDDGEKEYNYTTDHIYEFENPYNFHMPVSNDNSDRLFILFDYYNLKENPNITEKVISEDVKYSGNGFDNKGGAVSYEDLYLKEKRYASK